MLNQFFFSGDFSSFVIQSKSGNPVPQDFPFTEPTKVSPQRTPFGSLRRSISRTSLRYKSPSLLGSSKFPSMFSLRGENKSTKLTRKSLRKEKSNGGNKSSDSIDKIAEDEELVNNRNSPVNENPVDVPIKQIKNPFLNGGGKSGPFTNGNRETHSEKSAMRLALRRVLGETHFEKNVGIAVSKGILDEVINNIDVSPTIEETHYDDRKNPFMEEFYDESLSAA